MIVRANRASAILYNLLRSRIDSRPFLLPANVCPVVPAVFLKSGVPFQFVDVSRQDYCIDREQVLERVRFHRYGGVLVVRTYGFLGTLTRFFADLRDLDDDLLLIDDRCLCAPSFECPDEGADVILYSTGPRKFTDLGGGGFAFVDDGLPYRHHSSPYSPTDLQSFRTAYKRCIAFRKPFLYADTDWLDCGIPSCPMAEYQAAVTAETLEARATKTRKNARYRSALPEDIVLGEEWNDWRFCIRVGNKVELLDRIFSSDLFASSHYASLAGIFRPGDAPVARGFHDCVINLFNDRYVSESQVERLAALVARHAQPVGRPH